MHKGRLEAFSDGVIAIILTIMVLELKIPKEPTLEALSELWPVWLAYALSYYNVFVLWADHHQTFSQAAEIDRDVLFANGFFLFCASLIPFVTAFAGEGHWASPLPVVLYGLVMLAVSATFGRLRTKVANLVTDPQMSAKIRKDARHSYRLALFFFFCSLAALAHPRLGLIFFVAIPLVRRVVAGLRSRTQTGA